MSYDRRKTLALLQQLNSNHSLFEKAKGREIDEVRYLCETSPYLRPLMNYDFRNIGWGLIVDLLGKPTPTE